MADMIGKLTSEISVILLLSLSLVLFKTTFETNIGTEITAIYYGMLIFIAITYFAKRDGIIPTEVRQIPGNSTKSLLWAGGALALFTVAYSFVNNILRQSTLEGVGVIQQQSVYQSAFNGMVKFSSVDFSQLTGVKYYLFGFVIPLLETMTLVAALIWLCWAVNVPLDVRNKRLHALISILATVFMIFHLKVRGINNNIDLAMTFVFAYLTLVMVAKMREMEAANEFHVGTNMLALVYGR